MRFIGFSYLCFGFFEAAWPIGRKTLLILQCLTTIYSMLAKQVVLFVLFPVIGYSSLYEHLEELGV